MHVSAGVLSRVVGGGRGVGWGVCARRGALCYNSGQRGVVGW